MGNRCRLLCHFLFQTMRKQHWDFITRFASFFRVSNKGENFLKIIIISVMKSFDKSLNLGDFTPDTYVVIFIGVRSRYQKFLIVLTHFSKNGLGDKWCSLDVLSYQWKSNWTLDIWRAGVWKGFFMIPDWLCLSNFQLANVMSVCPTIIE